MTKHTQWVLPMGITHIPDFQISNQVELLLNNGAPINAGLEREGGSVLHHSVKAGNVEVVEALLENKVRLNSITMTFLQKLFWKLLEK